MGPHPLPLLGVDPFDVGQYASILSCAAVGRGLRRTVRAEGIVAGTPRRGHLALGFAPVRGARRGSSFSFPLPSSPALP
ncbi:hypothetical protein TTX_0150 [Thermoproteus tenax Kra 1]|uniref:Uncharacterized protein n=1 Tax=Thermoproteus tenax (strain ATCC 35583 / DSM 2078 / JCM 9277 / NBRC 100435 / Kra 1) TaxID=768679 RepID=G4RMJ6_THETK|nr:hypothetical protein TTX_0150 [Thermoproteus tenax Kra 1]